MNYILDETNVFEHYEQAIGQIEKILDRLKNKKQDFSNVKKIQIIMDLDNLEVTMRKFM